MTQLTLDDTTTPPEEPPPRSHGKMERYAPWPAPDGDTYSHYVVWHTCLAWELADYYHHRQGTA